MDEGLKDSYDVYADFFDDQSSAFASHCAHFDLIDLFRVEVATRSRWNVWGKAKKIFVKAGKTRKELQRRAVEKLEHHQVPLFFSLDNEIIEQIARLVAISDRRKSQPDRNRPSERINSPANIRCETFAVDWSDRRKGFSSS